MELKKFKKANNIISLVVLFVASFTYLSTIEPTASFWDCGEFIASSYKLEVGHPPGNPVFQLIARFFTLFGGPEDAAMLVNVMSAMCSAFTIFFLYLTIVHLGRRIVEKTRGALDKNSAIAVFGAGVVGALAYTFSDTFWFSAVEAEVYAMSSLFTAVVFWAMLKWEEEADMPYANRWIILIAFLMGISIGVHLLNLLTIPALVFIYYYKKYEVTTKRTVMVLMLSGVILATILYGIIPYLPKMAAYVDLLFVNVMGLPMNLGASLFVLGILAAGFWGIYWSYRHKKVLLNAIMLCVTLIVIGYSSFAVVVIRSCANTPTNEYQPDNPFTLVRYIGREQYGSNPLIFGETFASQYDEVKTPQYYNVLDGKYVKVDGPAVPVYPTSQKMLFPRMWSSGSGDNYVPFYQMYTEGRGKVVPGSKYKMPTMKDNLAYFFDYQMDFMYMRYFMWNFVGRQNDLQATIPGDKFKGNWESGISFIDKMRLGDQSVGPDYLVNNRAKNHYYFLPLILGLLGLFYQLKKDKRNWVVTMLLFILTGVAIVVYLNQPPYQVRERDYAYAGSFFSFSIWIGLAVAAVYSWIEDRMKGKETVAATAVAALLLCVPVLMAAENWDDHDRSNRYTAVEMAKNYLNSVGPNGILVTHGDNDTFPLWYAQEVENVRTDVRIANTSLLGTDWHIDQMKYAMNESAPFDLTVGPRQYLYGTNEFIYIYDTRDTTFLLSDVMRIFKHPEAKIPLSSGKMVDYIMSRKFIIPVNKENVLKYGILDEKYADMIPDQITLTIPKDKSYLTKPELFMLDLLSNYQWDRPINLLSMGGDINIGLKDYLMYEGFSYKFVPIKNRMKSTEIGLTDVDDLYNKMKNVYTWDALKRTDWFVDYHNFYTFCGVLSQRQLFVNVAKKMLDAGDAARAVEMLDMCQECVPVENFPLDMIYLGLTNEMFVVDMIETYYKAGAPEKALDLSRRFIDELFVSMDFFIEYYDLAKREFETCYSCISYLEGLAEHFGQEDFSKEIRERIDSLLAI